MISIVSVGANVPPHIAGAIKSDAERLERSQSAVIPHILHKHYDAFEELGLEPDKMAA